MYDVTALGEVLIDFACLDVDGSGYPTMKANPGGAPCNFLAALSAYGAKTAFLGKVGADAFGNMLLETLKGIGVETSGIVMDPAVFTTLAFVTFDASGDRSFSFARKPGADTQLREEELDYDILDATRVFHFGTLSLTDEPARSATQKAVAYARQKGCTITFDPNLRPPLWNNLEEAKKQILWGLGQADMVKISDEEVDFLWQTDEQTAAKILLEEYGVKLAFITLGAKGCYFAGRNGSGYVPGIPVSAIDTTGAGDIFGGSALSRILKLGKPLEELTVQELKEVTRFACTAASLSTQVRGGITSVPPEQRVLEHMEKAYATA